MAFLEEYEYLGELGKTGGGSFAQVYKVRHNKLGYVRAIRVLKAVITDENSKQYKDFINECKFLLRLGNSGHPNIVRVYQPRLIGNKAFWEMDYIEGNPVDTFIEKNNGFVPIEEVKRFLLDISNALAYCHVDNYWFSLSRDEDRHLIEVDPEDGSKIIISPENRQKLIKKYCVIHNDIKSNNVMRKFDGSYILLDFGLSFDKDKGFSRSSLMHNGGVEYKAPEKWDKNLNEMTERTDIYSFGITLYEMLTGQVPFPYNNNLSEGQAIYEISEHHKNTPPPPIEPFRKAAFEKAFPNQTYQKDYPDWLEKVILKCLEKDPKKRYANGKELYDEVKPLIEQTNLTDNREVEKLKNQNSELFNELGRISYKMQLLEQSKPSVVEKIVEKPVEVEKIVEKTIIKRVTNRFWVILSLLLIIASAALGFMYIQKQGVADTSVYETEISSLKTECDTLQLQLNDKKSEAEKLNNQIDDLQKQLQANGNTSEMQKIINGKNADIASLKNQLAKAQDDLKKAQTDLTKANSNSSGNTAALQQQINSKNREINDLTNEINRLNNENASQKKQIQQQDSKIKSLIQNM